MTDRRTLLVAAALMMWLTACGGSSSSGANPESTLSDPSADDSTPETSQPNDSEVSASPDTSTLSAASSTASDADEAPAIGTVTLGDGTVYDLQMYQCGTNESGDYDLNGFAIDVEVGGELVEKIEINFGSTGDSFVSGRFEGQYPDGRRFAYSAKDSAALTVDGQAVSGASTLDGPGGPLGDTLDVMVDVTCGVLADPPPFS